MKLKILISNDGYHAHYYIRLGLARAFSALGHQVMMWQKDGKPVHDAFDEFEPNIFLGQTYNVDEQVIEAILERPHLKCVMKASDWGPLSDNIDREKYPVLIANQKEIATLVKLKEISGNPTYLEIHYTPDAIENTHGHWMKNGFAVFSQLNAADIFEFANGTHMDELACDLMFMGGYWSYKAQVLDKFLLPLCKKNKYKIKIFGNSIWPVHQYCGFLPSEYTKHAIASAKICVNLHEPHSHKYGYDLVERPFKLGIGKACIVTDAVSGLKNLYPNEMVFCKTPEEMESQIDTLLSSDTSELRNSVFNKTVTEHTYLHRAIDILDRLGYTTEKDDAIIKTQEIINGHFPNRT